MSPNPTPAASIARPSSGPGTRATPRIGRMARWGCARLLRFAWLRATGRATDAEAADIVGDAGLPDPIAALIAILHSVAGEGRDGLRSMLMPWARSWFAEVSQRLFHAAGQENRDELEWLRWATQRRGRRPLVILLQGVLRQMDRPMRARRPQMAPRPPLSPERVRELLQDPHHQQALQRARGRRRLLRQLTSLLHARLAAAATAWVEARRTELETADREGSAASLTDGISTVDGVFNFGDAVA
ncbi:MAG: hypothetical protein R3D03_07525 [Geminicoccaceae bacterium]